MIGRERYQAGSSPLHQHDPRVKVVAALLLIVGIVITPDDALPAYPLLWSVVASLAVIGEISVFRLGRMGGLALPFTLAAITLLFTVPGKTITTIGGFAITDAGLIRFLAIIIKSWLAVQVALLLSITTHLNDLLWALSSLRVPQPLILIISFMYRYLFTLQDEAHRLIRARASRSGSLNDQASGGSVLWRARVTGSMIGGLFLRSYERSERVYMAMLARGYRGEMLRLNPPPLTGASIRWGLLPVAAVLLIQVLARIFW